MAQTEDLNSSGKWTSVPDGYDPKVWASMTLGEQAEERKRLDAINAANDALAEENRLKGWLDNYKPNYLEEYKTFNVKSVNGEVYTYEFPVAWTNMEIQLDIIELLTYPREFKQWFATKTKKDQYLNRAPLEAKVWTFEVEAAFNVFSEYMKSNEYFLDTEDTLNDERISELSSQTIDYATMRDIYTQSLAILVKESQRATDALIAAGKAETERILKLEAEQAENERVRNETLLEYLGRAFSAPEGSEKSMQDFFTRVLPYGLKLLPAAGTLVSMKYDPLNPMGGFGYYVAAQQAASVLSPAMYARNQKAQYQRPIYNITNNIAKFSPVYQRTPYKKRATPRKSRKL